MKNLIPKILLLLLFAGIYSGCDDQKSQYKRNLLPRFTPKEGTRFRGQWATNPNGNIKLSMPLPSTKGYNREIKYSAALKDVGDAIRLVGYFSNTNKKSNVTEITFQDQLVDTQGKVETKIMVKDPSMKARIKYTDAMGAFGYRTINLDSGLNLIDSYTLAQNKNALESTKDSKGFECIKYSRTLKCYTIWDRTSLTKVDIGPATSSKTTFNKDRVTKIEIALLNADESNALEDCPDELEISTIGIDSLRIYESPVLELPDYQNVANNEEIFVPVFADNLNAASLSLVINYDPDAVEFLGIENPSVPDISANGGNGEIRIGWYNVAGYYWPPNQNRFIVLLKFRSKGSYSYLNFSPETQATEVENGHIITDLNTTNGSINLYQ